MPIRHIAVIGSGPAGYYTAEACQKRFGEDVRIDIVDRLPTPYGLIRLGVAPDHQSIKGVARRYEEVALSDNVRFVGNVTVGSAVTIEELIGFYDAVVLATGAPADRPLGIPGDSMPGVIGSAAFVGWYNGHPEFADLDPPLDVQSVAVIGNGNVALDVARIIAKTRAEFAGSDIVTHALDMLQQSSIARISIVGRRGPHQIGMTPKELGELAKLERAGPRVDPADLPPVAEDANLDPGQRKSVTLLRSFAASPSEKPVTIDFDFFAKPVAIEGEGRIERLIVERTQLNADGEPQGTGEHYPIPCQMVIACIGYRTPPLAGVAYDEKQGRFANEEGRIAPGLYAVGWARRGPTGTIGTNRPDGFMIAEAIEVDQPNAAGKPGAAALDALLAARNIDVVSFHDWKRIDAAEAARARADAPREKFVDVAEMLAAKAE